MAQSPTPHDRKATLLEDADIRGWIKDHRSPNTAKAQLEQLELLLRRTDLTPLALVDLAAEKPNKRFRSKINDWVEAERKAGRPDLYIRTIWYAAKSWLRYNEVAVEWTPPLSPQPAATLEGERVPSAEELRRLLSVLSSRDRAAALFLASSGIRIGVLANRFEAGGLTLGAIPDLALDGRLPHFRKTPAIVHVPAALSKARKDYYTFITTEAAEALVAYLQDRKSRGERLTSGSALIGPEPKASHAHFRRDREDSLFISGKSLGNVLRVGLRKVMPPGVRVRPHTLRSWTSSQLELAERAGKVTRSLREYFLGHNLKSIELRYNLGKRLSPESLEELRAAYAKCEPFLTAAAASTSLDEARLLVKIELLKTVGLPAGDAERVARDDTADIASIVRERLGRESSQTPIKPPEHPGEQRVIDVESASSYIGRGWSLVSPLNSHLAVVRWEGTLQR